MVDSWSSPASLTVTRGPGTGRRFDLGAAAVTIGRHEQCDFQVEDTWMSRQHARIAWTGAEYIVEDLGSTNGTFVNGERVVGSRVLQSGDVLQLGGEVELAFQVGMAAPGQGRQAPPGIAPLHGSSAVPPLAYAPPHEPVLVQKGSFLQRRKTWVWALVLLGALLILIGGGVAYYVLSDRGQEAAGTPTVQAALLVPVTVTSAPAPDATPATTSLPTETPTPEPTETPTPEPTETPTPEPMPTPRPEPLVIKGEAFEADYEGTCSTDVAITEVVGDALRIEVLSGSISIREGGLTIWCYGAKHTWIGTLTYGGYTFMSDENMPLQFVLDRNKGYVYLSGKGSVVEPNGRTVALPQ